jgi:phospholipid/cholesterol/gamma-HCH transport system substrate-binding protein
MDIEAQERLELKRKQQRVAMLFVLAILLALVFAYWMGALGFGPSKTVYVGYNFAGGLERGSTVRLAGIRVGRVSDISFAKSSDEEKSASEGSPESLRLKIEISNQAFRQITEDSYFYINLAGLIGERYVEIVPGKAALVKAGHHFRGIDPPRVDQLLSQGYGIFGDLREFFSENKGDLKEMFATLNDLSKNIAKIIDGVSVAERKQIRMLLGNLSATSADLKSLIASLNQFSEFAKTNNSTKSYKEFQELLSKANKIDRNDFRRLMLEDGVKVNFSSKKVLEESK